MADCSVQALLDMRRVDLLTTYTRLPDKIVLSDCYGQAACGAATWYRNKAASMAAPSRRKTVSNVDAVVKDLVIANWILTREDVADPYGHVSLGPKRRRKDPAQG